MGRLYAIVLILSACGDNDVTNGPKGQSPDPGTVGGVQTPEPTAREQPDVCAVRDWTTLFAGDPAMDLSVVGDFSVGGAAIGGTVLAVPRVGGTMTGFVI